MHHPKPKSAPARLKSKFVKNRTNAMKEIEAWVRKDSETFAVPEASRMSGQLSDNVTEERMLKAKLWELSKERYKFLSQNTYEQKMFQDRQQKKSGLRRISSASSDGRHRLSHGQDKGPSDGRRTSLGLVSVKTRPKNARLALLDRLDPTKRKSRAKSMDAKKRDRPKLSLDSTEVDYGVQPKENKDNLKTVGTMERDEFSSRGRVPIVKFPQRGATVIGQQHDSKGVPPLNRSTSFPAPAQASSDPAFKSSSTLAKTLGSNSRSGTPVNATGPGFRARTHVNQQASDALSRWDKKEGVSSATLTVDSVKVLDPSSRVASASSSSSKPSWARRDQFEERFGKPIESMTLDPRYAGLEKKLCPLIRSKTTGDIASIVSNIESLHVRPKKRPPDAKKTKIELKAFEYMNERGFAF